MIKSKLHFNITLTDWQAEAYKTYHTKNVRELVLCCSRQIGKTVFAEILMIEEAIKTKYRHICYISPLYQQGKKIFRDITQALEKTDLIKSKNASSLTIELTNNSVIQCYTTKSPNAIRGTTCSGLLVCDEFAYFPELTSAGEDMWNNVILPITKTRRPKIVFISTPAGKQGMFYEKYLKGLDGKATRSLTFDIYADPFITKEELEELKSETPPKAFAQEFLVQFLDSGLTALDGFEKVFHKNAPKVSFTEPVWIGVDFSSVGEDETIVTAINNNNNIVQYTVEGTLDEKYKKIGTIIDNFSSIQGVYLEDNGIGAVMINEVKKHTKNKNKLHSFTTTHNSKTEIVGLLQLNISNNTLNLDENNTKLYKQCGVFIYQIDKKTKKVTYAAKPPHHDDAVMSLCLALKCKNDIRIKNGQGYEFVKSVNKTLK